MGVKSFMYTKDVSTDDTVTDINEIVKQKKVLYKKEISSI
jgi:pyruvate kinase